MAVYIAFVTYKRPSFKVV